MVLPEPNLDIEDMSVKKIRELENRIEELERQPQVTMLKGTAAASGRFGFFLIDEATNQAFIYAEGAWREITNW